MIIILKFFKTMIMNICFFSKAWEASKVAKEKHPGLYPDKLNDLLDTQNATLTALDKAASLQKEATEAATTASTEAATTNCVQWI